MNRLDILQPETADIREPMLRLLFGQMEYAFKSLFFLVEDMTVAELDYRGPSGTLNSTAMLLRHLAIIDLWWLHAFKGEPIPPELSERYGPLENEEGKLSEISGESLTALRSNYTHVHALLRAYVKSLTDADLDRPVRLGDQTETSVRWGLWHLAEHSMMHQGQIRWLRAWARNQVVPLD